MEPLILLKYALAILAGIIAGIINTLAGSGSLVTLPMLVWLGLDASQANATNRVGVLLQNAVGITTFQRSGKFNMSSSMWLLVMAIPGGAVGAYLATLLSKEGMNTTIGIVMVVMLFVILFDPQKWLREVSEVKEGRPSLIFLVIYFLVCVYGGFVQAGVGVFLLATMVLGAGYTLAHANAIKLAVILIVTLAALAVFLVAGAENGPLIYWGEGLLIAVGQMIGAWMAARFATRNKNANVWVRRLLITVVIISIFQFFGILEMLGLG
jgi:uncharacterized membrane protein YfcA